MLEYNKVEQQELHQLLLKAEENLSKEESDFVKNTLGSPPIQKYFRHLLLHSALEIMVNEAETSEQKEKLLSRFQKLKGIQYVCHFVINNFRKEIPKNEVQKS